MKSQLSVFALSAILVASLSTAPIYGQMMDGMPINAPIVVSTDKSTYETGDKIVINGKVARAGDGAVTIQIVGPDDSQNRVGINQVNVNIDGTFETEFVAGGPLMSRDGTYTVKAQYGSSAISEATATFELIVGEMPPDTTPETEEPQSPNSNIGEDTITIDDVDDTISYEINGGRILSVVPDVESKSLVITIETTSDGDLTMTIPRTILDAKVNDSDEDDDLFVLVDLEEAIFDETRTDVDRTVTVEFAHGAEEIEIIGTWVIPEFGVIAVMILAVAIISIIAISSRTRLSIVPRI